MPTQLPEGVTEADLIQLRKLVAQTFQNAQKTVASHRKLVASLKNVQDRAAQAGLEREFNHTFARMVNRVLPIKKSESCGDRVVKLCETFVSFIQTREDGAEDTVATRFVEFFIRHLIRGLTAKDKVVRYRSSQLIAAVINHLGDVGDELFDSLKYNLSKRLYDKEQTVRLQSALALSRLQGVDDGEDDDDYASVSQMLVSVLQNDPSADVRRAVLFNLEKNSDNLPYLLERAWDLHPTNRKAVYSRTMIEIGDFRLLTIKMREKILQWGLRDRDPTVKAAATEMFVGKWLDTTNNDLLEVLERLDVINSVIAETAMRIFFENRKDTLDKIEFNGDFWGDLTAEAVFLARTFNAFCVEHKLHDLIETRMPELTKLGMLIDHYLNLLLKESDVETTFIVEQLLIIAETYDYGDEFGRRNILSMLRDILVKQILSPELIKHAVAVIKKLSVSETDCSQVIVEVVSDIRDALMDSQEEDAEKELVALLSCLSIAQGLLEVTEKPLDTNVHLTSLLNGLIVPAVRSHDVPVRERGLRCLGLACLLSKDLTVENLQLFVLCFTKGHNQLKLEALRIVTDVLMIHGTSILDTEDGVESMTIYKMYYRGAKSYEEPEVQALAAEALCKLLMANIFIDDDLVKALILVFFDGNSAENQPLKQILSFCMPAYCYSSIENQRRVGRGVVDSVRRLCSSYENSDSEMISPTLIIQQLVDWTDPQRSAVSSPEAKESMVHLDLCVEILKRLRQTESKDERKALCSALNKLSFPSSTDPALLKEILEEVDHQLESGILSDSVSKNAVLKFKLALDKAISKLEDGSKNVGELGDVTTGSLTNTAIDDSSQDQSTIIAKDENDAGNETVETETGLILQE